MICCCWGLLHRPSTANLSHLQISNSSPPSSVIVASGSLRARRQRGSCSKRKSCKGRRFIIVVRRHLTQPQTITIPTRTTNRSFDTLRLQSHTHCIDKPLELLEISSRSKSMTDAEVKLYVYDLSNGLARALSLPLTGRQIDGIW